MSKKAEIIKDSKEYTILTYIKDNADKDFKELPFNEADNLILCQLSYLDYAGLVPGVENESPSVYLKDIFENAGYENIFKKYWYVENNKALIEMMVNSKRFGDLRMNFYSDIYNEEKDAQFAAVTYILGDGSVYIAYRGTDATLVGWKEDVKLAYSKPTRAQELALGYIKEVAGKIAGNFRCGGHSKGGNLAVYASMMCEKSISDRILDIYSNDGPGFRPEVISNRNVDALDERFHKFIPRESIVGIIMNEDDDFDIIDSYSIGTMQHNLYTWKCNDEGHLVTLSNMGSFKTTSDKALNEWIYSLSTEEIDSFIEDLFAIFTSADAKDVFDLIVDPKKTITSMLSTYKNLNEESKENFAQLAARFKSIAHELFRNEIKNHVEELKEKTDELVKEITVMQKD